jgi:Flp pilus assembly protein TadD
MMLGEALMQIDKPEEAMKAFGTARKESPRDAVIANQVGHALVVTHEYKKAVEHYEDSLVTVKEGPAKLELLYNFGGSILTN